MSASATPRDVVLVIDDSPETLGVLTEALENAGVAVLVALSGDKALDLVEEVTPDVILLDAIMPGMDGFETCRRLKRNQRMAHVPVIFMTGLSETEHIVKGFEAGGVDYLAKPLAPDELIARLRVHLANARLAQSARAALDVAGRFLLAADRAGHVLWSTPQAGKLLGSVLAPDDSGRPMLSEDAQRWLRDEGVRQMPINLAGVGTSPALYLSYVGQIGADEILLRLTEDDLTRDDLVLKQRLALTTRESEVLLWLARGKSNRDIGDILGLSHRTVNKHLEQIYTKLGVENRASAAALAVRAISAR